MEKMNAGFTIVQEEFYETETGCRHGIALGCKSTRFGDEWVTWGFTESDGTGERGYYWGHYFCGWVAATKDYHDRLSKEYGRLLGGE